MVTQMHHCRHLRTVRGRARVMRTLRCRILNQDLLPRPYVKGLGQEIGNVRKAKKNKKMKKKTDWLADLDHVTHLTCAKSHAEMPPVQGIILPNIVPGVTLLAPGMTLLKTVQGVMHLVHVMNHHLTMKMIHRLGGAQ